MITTLLAASLMLSCNPKEILEPTIDYPAFVVIDGDTVKTRKEMDKVKNIPYQSAIIDGDKVILPNYKKLTKAKYDKKNEDILKKGIEDIDLKGKPLRVLASGSYGGNKSLNNETIEFGLSNLIANQMGVEFNSPFFDKEDYNGAYTREQSKDNFTGGPLPKFKYANNNLAIESYDTNGKVVLRKAKQARIDNFVDPFGGDYNQGVKGYYISPYYNRFDEGLNYDKRVLNEKFDFLIDIGSNNDYIMNKGLEGYEPRKLEKYSLMPGATPHLDSRLDLFSDLIKRKGLKGILINTSVSTPSLYFGLVSVNDVRKELEKYQKGFLLDNSAKEIYPDAKLDSLLGSNVNMNLKPFIRNSEKILNFSNTTRLERMLIYDKPKVSKLSVQMGWPELDLNFLYVQIYRNLYVTHDGVKIVYSDLFDNSKLGNSQLHEIIVANEALKLINSYYSTSFPLYNTREFIK